VFIKASISEPGVIKKKALPALLKQYEFDNAIFKESECKTCKFVKYFSII